MTKPGFKVPKVASTSSMKIAALLVVLATLGIVINFIRIQKSTLSKIDEQTIYLYEELDKLRVKSSPISPKEKLDLEEDLLSIIKERITIQNSIYSTLAQILGASFFLVTSYLTLRNVRATEDRQITDRFSKAIEHLSSEGKTEIQVGGIYALGRIAKDSEKDYKTILDILTLFVRRNSQVDNELDQPNKVSASVQAALAVIGKCNNSTDIIASEMIDLSGTNLSKADLSATNFVGINLRGADLRGAFLSETNLSKASLEKSNLSKVNDERYRAAGDVTFREANLTGADLTDADFTSANFSNAHLIRTKFNRSILASADLSYARLLGADLGNADLSGADLSNAILNGAIFAGANIQGADFFNVRGITETQIRSAINFDKAKNLVLPKD